MSIKATSRLCDPSSKLRLAAEESSRNLAFISFDMLKCVVEALIPFDEKLFLNRAEKHFIFFEFLTNFLKLKRTVRLRSALCGAHLCPVAAG